MRWRSATEEVATSAAASSSTSTNSSSATHSTSRRSLNEQAEDSNGSHNNPSQAAIDDYNYDNKNAQQHQSDDTHYDGGDDAPDDTSAKRQKRALEMDKNVDGGVDDPPEDYADTTTSADRDTTTKAQQNTRKSPTSSSSSSSSMINSGATQGNRKTDEELDDDAEDEEDDGGTDHADETLIPNIVWKPQNVQSTCEFTHTILDYAQKRESGCKKAEYSAITQDELGNRWRLIVYVNGNGRASNHHLSLFLQVADADDLPFGWKKAVSYVLTLEHPTSAANLSYAKRNPDKTFKLCPKAIDWGWSQFITSDRIQQEGFVKLDTLTVRAQVTVKSSSVVIDEEDSELYLKCAVEEGDAKSVKLCLDQGASVNCQFKDDLYTPLHTACSSGTNSGSMDVLNLLLTSGADCNSCNKWKETPLLIAANNGHKAAVEALLEHGADPSLCSEAGWSALTFAAHKGFDDIVNLLLKKGAPVNCPVTEDASTPLHKACAGTKRSHLVAVHLLLGKKADVHALNKWRETPLLTAANHGNAGAVEALLSYGADPCKCTDTGWSPLSIAAYKGHDTCVRLLLEDGAPTEEDDPTLSALLQAATKGLPETVELLLRHGADHTVTTKKGDTALSILVEQNLIDAAVEMVTEYNASIPRCSRDRKKVQRARLLINLRMKQLEREGKDDNESTDDDEDSDGDNSTKDTNNALHVENGSLDGSAVAKEKKGKKEKPKELLEAKARLAEEALLEELEKEDAQAKVEEAKANNKNAKKKKKKERERLLKMKEDEERRLKEEKEMKERDRIRLEKEELRRKQRDEQKKLDEERAVKEMLEREKAMAAKRKEREELEKLERAQTSQTQRGSGSVSPTESRSSTVAAKAKFRASATDPTANRKIVSPKGDKKPAIPLPGSRRWETQQQNVSLQARSDAPPFMPINATSIPDAAKVLHPRESRSMDGDTASVTSNGKSSPSVSPPTQSVGPLNGVQIPLSPMQFVGTTIEHPAVALFRREKVTELLQRSASTFLLVGETIVKRVLHRWIVRAAHGKDPFIDPILPSWIDFDQLVAFFQRQFISESRRHHASNVAGFSMEPLKEAGASFARLCHDFAKQIYVFRCRIDGQLPTNWTDAALGMSASDSGNLSGSSVVTISWANNAQVAVSSVAFASLRDRHAGAPSRFLASAFITRVLYETFHLVVASTNMEVRLPSSTVATLSAEMEVSAELWSDPFAANSSNVFWGHFEHVDALFGGQKPFSKDDHGSEEILAQHGGSVCVLLPMDTMISVQYVHRMVDILDLASASSVPLSFAVFLSSECFIEPPLNSNSLDLRSFDPRLGDQKSFYKTRVDVLPANNHGFLFGEGEGNQKVSATTSYLVLLQNEAGRYRFNSNDLSTSRVLGTLMLQTQLHMGTIVPPAIANDIPPPLFQQPGYFDIIDPITPDSQRVIRSDFGSIGGSTILHTFSPTHGGVPRAGHGGVPRAGRRGRLFDLVDDGDEEQLTDDIMSGMLNNLDVGLFQNTSVGADNVDIEAISLMGIGGPSRSFSHPSSNFPGHRLG